MAIYKRDIASINLETGTIHRTFLNHSIGYKDQKADHFGIRVFRDGEPVDLTHTAESFGRNLHLKVERR